MGRAELAIKGEYVIAISCNFSDMHVIPSFSVAACASSCANVIWLYAVLYFAGRIHLAVENGISTASEAIFDDIKRYRPL